MREIEPIRSALFVPGNRPDRVEKAFNLDADVIVADLEDAVPPHEKDKARAAVREKVLVRKHPKLIVRVNGLSTGLMAADLEAVVAPGLYGLMTPKVDEPADLVEICRLIQDIEVRRGLQPGGVILLPLLESAKAVENVLSLAKVRTEPERPIIFVFGAADFTVDLGVDLSKDGFEIQYPRAKIAVACRAAGGLPPIDTPFMPDLKDLESLRLDAIKAKRLGFQGKLCVHPGQVPIVNQVFSPTPEEVIEAHRLVAAFDQAVANGTGVIQVEGKFIDLPIVIRAKRILSLAALSKDQR